jgi:hypothetical protein
VIKKKQDVPWDDGVVCQLLFGVSSHPGKNGPLWDANLVFRCGHPSSRHKKGNRRQNDGSIEYCHKQSKAHYRFVLAEHDLLGTHKRIQTDAPE